MLHPQAQAFLDRIARAGTPPLRAIGVDAARAMGPRLQRLAGSPEPVARVEDLILPGNPPVRIRRYSPTLHDSSHPTLIYAHGGGFVLGDLDGADVHLRALANRSGWNVVSVDYRLAPEHPYPAAAEDMLAALKWGAGSASVLAVGGDSAGGALATQAALWWAENGNEPRVDLLLAIYPALDDDLDRHSYHQNGGYGLSRDDVAWFLSLYLPDGVDRAHALPLKAPSLDELPRTFVLSAEYDVVFDEAVAFVARLRDAGVPVDHHVQSGMVHGFLQLGGIMDAAADGINTLAEQLRAVAAPTLPISD